MHPKSEEQARYVRRETWVGCVFNAALSVVFAFLVFRGQSPIPLWGAQGLAVDLIPTVFMITLVGNLIATLITRRRVARGHVAALISTSPVPWHNKWLPVRLLLWAVALTVVLVPLTVAAFWLLQVHQMDFGPFVVFKAVYGAAVGTLSAPHLLRAALADRVLRPAGIPDR